MNAFQSSSAEDIVRRGNVKDADVLRLRAEFYADGVIDQKEAEKIFAINDAARVQDASWADFFVEALTDHIINGTVPEGYLTSENASWLIAMVDRDGRVDTKTELDLLVNVLDKARWSPESLVRYTLDQVKSAVVTGEGPLRNGKSVERGTITEGEVELLRRILYAFGGDGHVAITRSEAEVLFEINDTCDNGTMNAAWTDLFVKAIANVLMASSGYAPPSREEALRRETWLDSRGDLSFDAMIRGMASATLQSVRACYREQSSEERALARLERQRIEIITNEEITQVEADWLAERIGRDGRLTVVEAAVLDYLTQEGARLHPSLSELRGRLKSAA